MKIELTDEQTEYLIDILIADAGDNARNPAFQQEYQHAKDILTLIARDRPGLVPTN